MSLLDVIERRVSDLRREWRRTLTLVTNIKFDDDGTVTCDEVEDGDCKPSVAGIYGFSGRPKDGAGGILARLFGQGNTAVLIGFRHRDDEPAIEKGESVQYGAGGSKSLHDKDGNIKHDSAAGKKVLLQGGGKYVVRDGDVVVASALFVAWAQQVEVFINGLVPGTVAPLFGTFANGVLGIGKANASTTKTESG